MKYESIKKAIAKELYEFMKHDEKDCFGHWYLVERAEEYVKEHYPTYATRFEDVDYSHIANLCGNHYIQKIVYFKNRKALENL